MISSIAILAASIVMVATQMAHAQSSGLVERSLNHDGLTRYFLEYKSGAVQPGQEGAAAATVILLHGGTQGMNSIFNRQNPGTQRWLTLADDHGFLLLAPNGVNTETGDTRGETQNWNDLRPEIGGAVDDVGFLAALVGWAATERGADPDRIYVTGASNGGMMTYTMLVQRPQLFAAGAVFIQNLIEANVPVPSSPTPIFIMNANKDNLVPWDGGTIADGDRGVVRSAVATRDWWIQANGADTSAAVSTTLKNRSWLDKCRIQSEFYPAFDATTGTAPVHFYIMDGGGHMIPYIRGGRYGLLKRFVLGPACRDVYGADLAYEFLSQYSSL